MATELKSVNGLPARCVAKIRYSKLRIMGEDERRREVIGERGGRGRGEDLVNWVGKLSGDPSH